MLVPLAALTLSTPPALAGPYAAAVGAGGVAGVDGIAITDSRIKAWATSAVTLTRGPQDIANPAGPNATWGAASDALGPAQGEVFACVSLGDGGSITLGFDVPIRNGPGPDFAVFENGFRAGTSSFHFLELAFVEVSSDGVNFARFPSVSLTPADDPDWDQTGTYGTLDATDVHNLAGKQPLGWGTPFDLADVAGAPGLNLLGVRFVRLTDVVGRITPTGTWTPALDSRGYPINDSYPTPFATGGFDLDGVAVLNATWLIPEPAALSLLGPAAAALVRRRRRSPGA